MKRLKELLVLVGLCMLAYQGQAQQHPFVNDHEYYLSKLGNAKDSLYRQILTIFDEHIRQHPDDVKAQLEKCKVIEKAYYDSYEDYNPNDEEAEACAKGIVTRFPRDPEALLYQTEFLYGDSLTLYLGQLSDLAEQDPETWKHYSWDWGLSRIYST